MENFTVLNYQGSKNNLSSFIKKNILINKNGNKMATNLDKMAKSFSPVKRVLYRLSFIFLFILQSFSSYI